MALGTWIDGSEVALDALDDDSGWLDLRGLDPDKPFSFQIAGTWVGTISLDSSCQVAATKTRYTTISSYTANTAPRVIPIEAGLFVRFRMSSYTSGTAYVGFSESQTVDGQRVKIAPQGSSNSPSGDFN